MCGKVVVTPILKELLGNHALYTARNNSEVILKKMQELAASEFVKEAYRILRIWNCQTNLEKFSKLFKEFSWILRNPPEFRGILLNFKESSWILRNPLE
jgi:hypothetical protein